MGHRLSKITTRTGDTGTTGLGDGSRVPKDSLRVEALGAVDELNSCIGLLLAEPLGEDLRRLLIEVQHDLFDLGGELSIPGHTSIRPEQIARLEAALDHHNGSLAPLKEFVLPGRAGFAVLPAIPEPAVGPAVRRQPSRQPAQWAR
jgi:cob(I)alamin adenosyltransferase